MMKKTIMIMMRTMTRERTEDLTFYRDEFKKRFFINDKINFVDQTIYFIHEIHPVLKLGIEVIY